MVPMEMVMSARELHVSICTFGTEGVERYAWRQPFYHVSPLVLSAQRVPNGRYDVSTLVRESLARSVQRVSNRRCDVNACRVSPLHVRHERCYVSALVA